MNTSADLRSRALVLAIAAAIGTAGGIATSQSTASGLANLPAIHVNLSTASPARIGANGTLTWSALATLGFASRCEYNFTGDLVFSRQGSRAGLISLSSGQPSRSLRLFVFQSL